MKTRQEIEEFVANMNVINEALHLRDKLEHIPKIVDPNDTPTTRHRAFCAEQMMELNHIVLLGDWCVEDNQEYIDSWYNSEENQMDHGNGLISMLGTAPEPNRWLNLPGKGRVYFSFSKVVPPYEAFSESGGSERFSDIGKAMSWIENREYASQGVG